MTFPITSLIIVVVVVIVGVSVLVSETVLSSPLVCDDADDADDDDDCPCIPDICDRSFIPSPRISHSKFCLSVGDVIIMST